MESSLETTSLSLKRLTLLPDLFWGINKTAAMAQIASHPCSAPVLGQFACALEEHDRICLIRDRLGLNKLFYHVDPESGSVTIGHYLHEVADATGDYNRVMSVPAGHYLTIDRKSAQTNLVNYWDLGNIEPDHEFDLDRFQAEVDRRLCELFQDLDRQFSDTHFVVCLSGGLDSSIIATYAKRFLTHVTAASFSYENLSDDFLSAEAIACNIDLPFLPIVEQRVLDRDVLDDILRFGQDWRDFNVHCAWVNYHIARYLSGTLTGKRVIVLTGDLMNEYVADYTAEQFDNTTYYRLPRVSRDRLRRFLIRGLDAGDRELGIFRKFGFTTVQPYSVLAESYLGVPAELLRSDNCKALLNLPLIADAGLDDLLVRKKTRAQVGGSDGGTLGLFHESGIGQAELDRRWVEIFLPTAREAELTPMILSGRYRD